MPELATGYVSLVIDTKRVPGQIRSAFGSADAIARSSGRQMGGTMSVALGTALGSGITKAASAAAGGIKTVLSSTLGAGFQRLNSIDQAQAKLRALGSTGSEVDAIMKNALASVKGTAFGLGDAAGLAGTMVASGIKPGKELEETLRLVADSAAIAGTDLNDMGMIFGKIVATGKLDGESLAQLLERQIGILPELAKHYGVTTEEISKMVSEGKVSFEDFATVMKDKVGGGAEEMGQTVQGAFENLKAAAGRVGASALEPLFKALPGGFGGITDAIDQLEPKVAAFVESMSKIAVAEWAPKIKEAFNAFKESGEIDRLMSVLKGLAAAGENVWPALQDIGTALAKASAAIGFGTWRIFLTTLEAVGGALNLVEPVLSTIGDLMAAHPGVVALAVAAWAGFKTIPTMMGRITTAISPVTTGLSNMRTGMRSFGQDMAERQRIAAAFGGTMSNTSAALSTLRGRMPILQSMSTAYRDAARNAGSFSRTQGFMAGGAAGVKGALGGVVGALGGPVGLGLTATLGVGMWALSKYQEKQQEAAEKARIHKERVDELVGSINAYTSALDANGREQIAARFNETHEGADVSTFDVLTYNQGRGLDITKSQFVDAAAGDAAAIREVNAALDEQLTKSIASSDIMDLWGTQMEEVGLSAHDLMLAMRGNSEARAKFEDELFFTNGTFARLNRSLDETGRNAIELGNEIGESNKVLDDATKKARDLDEAMGGVAARVPKLVDSLKGLSKGESIEVDTKSIMGAEDMLRRLGFAVKDLGNGNVKVTAQTEEAAAKLQNIKGDVNFLNLMKANPEVGMNATVFTLKSQEARTELANLDRSEVNPKVGAIIDKLLEGKAVSMNELAALNAATANPVIDTQIDKIMQKIGTVDSALNNASRNRTTTIFVQQAMAEGHYPFPLRPDVATANGYRPNASGNIVGYVDGGIAALEAFANGGLKPIDKPTRADIFRPQGAGVVFAEQETGGEAYIPLAPGKRRRSTDILATVADIFGMQLLPKGGSLSGWMGDLAGGAVSSLLQKAGADGLTRFADGGVTADSLRDLAEGIGASQPLKGAPYVWGGVDWGDCCLTWETPVWGPHGSKPIGLLRPGDKVWSYVDGKIEAHEVTAQWFSKRQEVFKVRTRHRSVTGSANHPFLRVVQTAPAKPRVGRRGWDAAEYGVEWARLDQLAKGDLLVQPKSVGLDREVSNTLPSGREVGLNEAWLLGLILGDGSVQDTQVEICVYGDLRDRARSVLSTMRLDASASRGERAGIGTSESQSHGIRAHSTQFARELDEAGFRKPAHEKSIPECVWSWDQDRQRAFLNGYCDADGHRPKDVARHGERTYASSSRRLIEDVRYLHITLGDVVANVTTNHRSKPIVINGKRVKNARPLHSISVRPVGESLVASVAAMRLPGVVDWVESGDFTVAPILDVTPVGEEDTYDIEVAGSANFIAGGVVVHNSGAMSALTRAAAGLSPFAGRWSTGTAAADLAAMGFQQGRWQPGSMGVGFYNGGPGGGHTAGTLPDGTNVEMGGSYGGGMVGGSVGANDAQFTDHWFMPVGPGSPTWTDPGSYPGGYQRGQAGDNVAGSGNYGAGGSGAPGSGESTISGRFGAAASAFVSGQIADILDVFGINDSPGALNALSELEKSRSQTSQEADGTGKRKLSPEEKQQYKDEKAAKKTDFDAAKLTRDQAFETAKQELENKQRTGALSRAEYERQLADLIAKHDRDELDRKQEHEEALAAIDAKYGQQARASKAELDRKKLDLKQQYDADKLKRKQDHDAEVDRITREYEGRKLTEAERAEKKRRIAEAKNRFESEELKRKQEHDRQVADAERAAKALVAAQPGGVTIRDPGMHKPGEGEDLGKGKGPAAGSVDAVKAAFKEGLRPPWRTGVEWDASDWIIGKESSWKPDARNGDHSGLGQYTPQVWADAGIEQSDDPTAQGKVFDHYVGGRYGVPTKAKEHWVANSWYDQGGEARGVGFMQKAILEPERVLSPDETSAFQDGMRRGFAPDESQVVALLQQVVKVLVEQGPNGVPPVRDQRAFEERQQSRRRRMVSAGMGGRVS